MLAEARALHAAAAQLLGHLAARLEEVSLKLEVLEKLKAAVQEFQGAEEAAAGAGPGYPEEYAELVRLYLRALAEQLK